jgi:hypothetical protein
MSKFAVAGVSRCEKGNYRVRVANDFAGRIKILVRGGHTDVELRELPEPMTKGEAVTWLKASELYAKPEFAAAIDEADAKYNSTAALIKAADKMIKEVTVKVKASKEAKMLADLVVRARAEIAPEWRDTEDAPF